MRWKIIIKTESGIKTLGEIFDDEAPNTARKIVEALPIEGSATKWGDEIYFMIDLKIPPENAREKVKLGEIAYWPEGPAICLFLGPTPISPSPEDIRAYSPVNVIGRITESIEELKKIKEGERIQILLSNSSG